MGMDIETLITKVIGKRCRIETVDGSVRHEKVWGVKRKAIKVGKEEAATYPQTLFFDEGASDGVDLHILASIRLDEPEG